MPVVLKCASTFWVGLMIRIGKQRQNLPSWRWVSWFVEFEIVVLTDQITALFGCRFQILTAPGPGAVAVIQLTGGNDQAALWLRCKMMSNSSADQSLNASQGMIVDRIYYGRWNSEDLVVVRTSESTFEIQCHGGRIAIDRITCDLQDAGATEQPVVDVQPLATLREQVEREIELRLPTARSRRIAGLILAQATNSLCDDLAELKSASATSEAVAAIRRRLERWQNIADHLSEPWRVVLAGAPNVGKSSLLNAIAGMERSIVYDQPGTTRDIIEVDTVIDGWPFRFVDTAGIRMDGDAGQIESLGIQQSYLAVSHCDVLCLVVDDRSESLASIESLMLNNLPMHVVVVRNKCDLATDENASQSTETRIATFRCISVSASMGYGLDDLLQWIKLAVVPEEPTRETAIPILPI